MPVVPEDRGEQNPGGIRENPYRSLNYQVEVDSIEIGGFQRVSGLTTQMETMEYREGGQNESVHQLPGQFSHGNLVLERGLTNRTALWSWIQEVRSPSVATAEARYNVRVKLRGGYKVNKMWGWEFHDAYPVQWDGPELSSQGSGDVVAVQSVELAHDGFVKIAGTP